jgi:hypothetical protein
MGKSILFTVIGLSVTIGVIIMKLNANSKESLNTTVEYFSTTQARLIANSGIEVFLEKLRRDKYLTGKHNNNLLFEGNYDIDISGNDSNMTIISTGYFNDKIHITKVRAKRLPVELPPVYGSLFVSSSTLSLNLNGNMEIDGNDTNVDGSPGGEDAVPGIAVDDPADSAFIVNDLKPKISNDIIGEGASPSVKSVVDTTNWMQITQDLIFAADTTLRTGTYSTGSTFGTMAKPIITFANGDISFSGSATGAGIMIINGNVNMSGNFTYYGIIIVYGKSTIETQITGNGGIYGSTILVGEAVDIHSTGNASFYYSSQAINNAKTNLKSSRFLILSWWE